MVNRFTTITVDRETVDKLRKISPDGNVAGYLRSLADFHDDSVLKYTSEDISDLSLKLTSFRDVVLHKLARFDELMTRLEKIETALDGICRDNLSNENDIHALIEYLGPKAMRYVDIDEKKRKVREAVDLVLDEQNKEGLENWEKGLENGGALTFRYKPLEQTEKTQSLKALGDRYDLEQALLKRDSGNWNGNGRITRKINDMTGVKPKKYDGPKRGRGRPRTVRVQPPGDGEVLP